jgi:septal ring factor EnvC (AmiA/AmiB activator)
METPLGSAPMRNGTNRLGLASALVALLALAVPAAQAQDAEELARRRQASSDEYEQVTREITLSKERIDGIRDEIAGLRKDEQTLTAALIQAAKTERKLSQDADAISAKIEALSLQEQDLKLSLADRRGVLAEVLAALQRMGLNPPPAILVRPEDALASVRSAILLGAVVPEMRAETEILAGDLRELSRLSASISAERARLLATASDQAAEKERLALLVAEKSKLRGRSEELLEAEQKRSAELAAKAGSLKELIESLEDQVAAARAAEERASGAVPDENRLVQPVPFPSLMGKLALPAAGRVQRSFGDADGAGGNLYGDIVTTQSGAIVTAPADGVVLYAGPFRSYGQLLILNAGGGYHVVLAGMGRISVSLGQSVLAGEPVGTMGEARLASAVSIGSETTAPELYVEFRKDGKPVDPAPWWAATYSGRTGNDT